KATGDVVVERVAAVDRGLVGTRAGRFLTHKQTVVHGRVGPGVDNQLVLAAPNGERAKVRLRFSAHAEADRAVSVPELVAEVADLSSHVAGAGINEPLDVGVDVDSDVPVVAERFLRAAGQAGPAVVMSSAFALEEPEPVGFARLALGAAIMAALVVAAGVALL